MESWFERIRQRQIVQWALAYLAGAWALLEVVDMVGDRFGWPVELHRILIVLAAVGLLVVLVLAWYHGEKGRQRASGVELLMLAALFVVAGAAVAVVGRSSGASGDGAAQTGTPAGAEGALPVAGTDSGPTAAEGGPAGVGPGGGEPGPGTIAVLPFRSYSPDPGDGYFADGLTEELIHALASVAGLRVTARTSAFAFEDSRLEVRRIADSLGVGHVLEGTVRKAGDELRITARLVDSSGFQLWSAEYERSLVDVFAIQTEIARSIVDRLAVELSDAERARLEGEARTENFTAYEHYLRGRSLWNRRDAASVREALGHFERALGLDPDYAQAWAGVADAYTILGRYSILPPDEAHPRAREAAERALELDPGLGEAHASLGAALADYYWDWDAAGRHLEEAIRLSPSYATARQWYAEYLYRLGRFDEAIREARTAVRLDPLSPPVRGTHGHTLHLAGLPREALTVLQRFRELNPEFSVVHLNMGLVYLNLGEQEAAIAEFERLRDAWGPAPDALGLLGHAYARAGRESEAREILASLDRRAATEHISPFHFAVLQLGLREREEALDALEAAYEERHWLMGTLAVEPLWDPLRDEPRFQALVRRIGLE